MRRRGLAVVAALSVGQIALAHHSTAMFDMSKVETVQGVVKEFKWTNPHSWLALVVKDASGAEREYNIELTSPNLLSRRGWRPSSLRAGDQVTVVLNPFRDSVPGGRIVSITTPTGQVLTER